MSDLEYLFAFQLGYPDRKLSPNARGKWILKESARKSAKVEGYTSARNALESQTFEVSTAYAVDITFYPPDRRRRDIDNAFSSIKNHLDGACQALGINDTLFKTFTLQFGEPVKNGRVNVGIKPLVKSGEAVEVVKKALEVNGGLRNKAVAIKLKAEGVLRGIPDTFLPLPRGGYSGLYIEFKHGTNKTSPEQKEFLAYADSVGYKTGVAYSVDQALEILDDYMGGLGFEWSDGKIMSVDWR